MTEALSVQHSQERGLPRQFHNTSAACTSVASISVGFSGHLAHGTPSHWTGLGKHIARLIWFLLSWTPGTWVVDWPSLSLKKTALHLSPLSVRFRMYLMWSPQEALKFIHHQMQIDRYFYQVSFEFLVLSQCCHHTKLWNKRSSLILNIHEEVQLSKWYCLHQHCIQ